jgi:hypothetical protein
LEELALPSVASKNGGVVHPFSQKPWPISKLPIFIFFKIKKFKKNGDRPAVGRRLALAICPHFFWIFFLELIKGISYVLKMFYNDHLNIKN